LVVASAGTWNGIGVGLGNLWRLADAETRSISPENFTGAKGRGGMATEGTGAVPGRELGPGWKISPSITIKAHATFVLADIAGSGTIQHIWLTPMGGWRDQILRMYWDDDPQPAVECPVGDFFACGWGEYAQVSSLAVCVNPGSAFNCYWEMPFQRRARITLTNESDKERLVYYQVTYSLCDVPDDAARFCAQFRRVNPLRQGDVVRILDGVIGRGHYIGTYCAWGVNNSGWWGEGELKFFIDGDDEFPTICGTGTEDYFCGSYNFDVGGDYKEFTTPYAGMPQVLRPDGTYRSQQRFGLYRWHLTDPIRFRTDLRVTMQALGWRRGGRYLQRQDDIATVAYWYQTLPLAPYPELPDGNAREII
jgi:D-arabinan exo alpha-(1,3)/(1,5)-arabinofuranosidase (non-reducing end)